MTIDTKNLRALAEATTANHANTYKCVLDTYKCVLAEQAFYSAASPATVIQLLDALERKDNLLREQLTICKYLSRSICMTDETGADTNPDNIVDSSIEAITKEIGT